MLPPISTGCPIARSASGRLWMAGTEGARRALAMHEQLAPLRRRPRVAPTLQVLCDTSKSRCRSAFGKEVREDPARVVAEDLAVGERAVDRRAHGAEIALADLGLDRGAGQLAIGQRDARARRGHHHLPQELGADLMAETARAAMDGDDDLVLLEAEGLGRDLHRRFRRPPALRDSDCRSRACPSRAAGAPWHDRRRSSGSAPAIWPSSSMRSRSRASPQPRSIAQRAPPASMASISSGSRVIAPLLPTPAGIWRIERVGQRLLHRLECRRP